MTSAFLNKDTDDSNNLPAQLTPNLQQIVKLECYIKPANSFLFKMLSGNDCFVIASLKDGTKIHIFFGVDGNNDQGSRVQISDLKGDEIIDLSKRILVCRIHSKRYNLERLINFIRNKFSKAKFHLIRYNCFDVAALIFRYFGKSRYQAIILNQKIKDMSNGALIAFTSVTASALFENFGFQAGFIGLFLGYAFSRLYVSRSSD